MCAFLVDFQAAFDRLDKATLWRIMEKAGVSETLVNRIAEIYGMTSNVVRIRGEDTEEFFTDRGVRQECPLSPALFALYISYLEEEMREGQNGGTPVGQKKYGSLLMRTTQSYTRKRRRGNERNA